MRLWVLAFSFFLACESQTGGGSTYSTPISKAQHIVDRAIEVHGSDALDHSTVEFNFRDRHYRAIRQDGKFQYERIFTKKGQELRDILTNEGLIRKIDDQRASIPDTMAAKYANSVNSVIYFAFLPFNLNDPAVIKTYLGEEIIKRQGYYRVGITFRQEGGGKDYEDAFVYWFHQKTGTLDYLAYSYLTDGGGMRFRVAKNPRRVGGVLWLDYDNYKAELGAFKLEELARVWESGQLELLSEIDLEDIEVSEDASFPLN